LEEREQNVFGLLDSIRARPSMYLLNSSLRELETLLWGYYAGLRVHGMVEPVPRMDRHFLTWLHCRTRWSYCRGWAAAIEQRHPEPDKALAAFFALVDDYRRLKPTGLCTVRLGAQHSPTGKRVRIGLEGLIDKPFRVDVIRYRPESLHFLRFHYPGRVEDWDVLMTGSGEYTTTVRYAKEWVRDEFQVEFAAWESMPRTRRGAKTGHRAK
jgi:hypothetical protein